MKVFGTGDIVCSVFVLHLTSQNCTPLLELPEPAFLLEMANPTTVLWDNSFFDLDVKVAVCISVSLSWSLLTALSVQL